MIRSGIRQLRRIAVADARPFAAQAAPAAEDQIEVFVDGKSVMIPKGSSTLQACDAAGVDIPR